MWFKTSKLGFLTVVSTILLLFFTVSFLIKTDLSFNQDLGRHLRLGEIIVQVVQVPNTNLFSYTYPDFPFLNHHYLFEVVAFLGQKYLGANLLLILKIMIILVAVGLTLARTGKHLTFLSFPLAFIFLHVLRDRVGLRPEIFSYLFTAATLYILNSFENKQNKLIFILPAIQLLWANSHIYFILGIFIQAVFLVHLFFKKEATSTKTLLIVLGTSILASLITPNTLSGLIYPLTIFGNYGYSVAENQSLFLLESLNYHDPNFLFVKIAAFTTAFSVIVGWYRHTLNLKNLVFSLAGVWLALANIRSFPYLFLLALPAALEKFGPIKSSFFSSALIYLTAVALLGESFFYLNGDYYRYNNIENKTMVFEENGRQALDFVLENTLPQPIFNNFDIGSYIIYRGYPKYRVFVDGRPEAYPADFFQKIYIPAQENPQVFQSLDDQLNFQTIIFSHTDQTPWAKNFLQEITKNPKWKIVFLDDFMIVLTKNDVAVSQKLPAINLENLDPASYHFSSHLSYIRLAVFLFNSGHTKAAAAFAKRAVEVFPDSPQANLILATISNQTDNLQKSKNPFWW